MIGVVPFDRLIVTIIFRLLPAREPMCLDTNLSLM